MSPAQRRAGRSAGARKASYTSHRYTKPSLHQDFLVRPPKSISSRLWPGTSSRRGSGQSRCKHRGVNIGYIVAIVYSVETQFTCGTVDYTALDPAAGNPGGEPKRMTIAGILRRAFDLRR
jgi:hypothetical protein